MKKQKRRRNKITTRKGPLTAPLHTKEVLGFQVASWCPDLEAKAPPEQVHFALDVEGLPYKIIVRFKSPDTIGDLIDQLIEYRREVWKDATPVQGESNNTPYPTKRRYNIES